MEDKIIEGIIIFSATFLFIVLIYLCFVNRKRKDVKTEGMFTEPSTLIYLFNLDTKKIPYKKIMWITTYLNAFILGLTCAVVALVTDKLLLQLLIAFVMLLVLIMASYGITGTILVKKGYAKKKKNEGSGK